VVISTPSSFVETFRQYWVARAKNLRVIDRQGRLSHY
jgi:hypothetical protein